MYQYWRIAFISQVVSLLSSRMTIGGSAALYVLWCLSFFELCRLPTVFRIIWKEVFALAVPFRPIIHWSVGALGSALPSTLDSNHALWNLRTAWQYSPMIYRMLHYIDFVNAFTKLTYLINLLNTIVNFGFRVPVFWFRISGKPDLDPESDPPDVASNYPDSDPVEKTKSGTLLFQRLISWFPCLN